MLSNNLKYNLYCARSDIIVFENSNYAMSQYDRLNAIFKLNYFFYVQVLATLLQHGTNMTMYRNRAIKIHRIVIAVHG